MLGSSSSRVGRGSKWCRFLAGTVVQQEVHSALGYVRTAVAVRSWLCKPVPMGYVCIPFQIAQTLIKIP